MVHAPVANGIRESRHVAVYGLPQTITDENLQKYFGRFGPIQGLRHVKDYLHITFMDSRSAGVACKSEPQYNNETPYRIEYYNPETSHRHSMASVPTTPTFPAHNSSPRHFEDRRSPPRSRSERNGPAHKPATPPPPPPPKPFESPEHWTAPAFANAEYVACIVYEVQLGTTLEREVFELVKERVKRAGEVANITIFNVAPGIKRFTAFFIKRPNVDVLNNDTSLLLGKAPKQRVFYAPASNGWQPSTSYAFSDEELLKASISIHVPCKENTNPDGVAERFEKYGNIVEVVIVKSHQKGTGFFAVVQFFTIEDAHRALSDPILPKPMQYISPSTNRVIISHIPESMTREDVIYAIRKFNDEIADICVDWIERRAVLTFDSQETAKKIIKIARSMKSQSFNFAGHKVNVDFCSERLNEVFREKKKEGERALKEREQSSSRDQENRRESIGPKSSVEDLFDENELHEASSSNNINNSGSPEEEVNDIDDDPRIGFRTRKSVEQNHEDEEVEYSPGPSHEHIYDPTLTIDDDFEPVPQPEGESEAQPRDYQPDSNGMVSDYLASRMSQPSTSYADDQDIYGEPGKKSSFIPEVKGYREPKEEIKMEGSTSPLGPIQYFKMDVKGPKYKRLNLYPLKYKAERIAIEGSSAKDRYEKSSGRPLPNLPTEDLTWLRKQVQDTRNYYRESGDKEIEVRLRDWKRQQAMSDRRVQEYQLHDSKELTQNEKKESLTHSTISSSSSGRPSMDETIRHRLSFDATHHPGDLTQRSQSLCIGPMTPSTPYPQPLQVNINQHPGFSLPSGSGVTTPRSTQPPPVLMSPVSRHNSMSSTGRPASIQTLRHQSVVLPDLSVPPPSFTPFHEDLRAVPSDPTSSRRSSETLAPLKSPPFYSQNIPNLSTLPPTPAQMAAATGTGSVSSSAHSTPRHSISGTPVHYEPPSTSKANPALTPKTSRPEKVQARHDSISKPGPSNAASALQARSQSMTDPRKSTPSTPVVRDAGSDLIAQIMSNEPSQRFKKLPRIEKKPSALQNVQGSQNQTPTVSTPTTPAVSGSLSQAMLLKDKEKEKEKRRREKEQRELEREREARKEMKKKETKEERQKRKEMEKAKREEEERRERKREKQKMKEKEERRKEKERERRKAEKEKLKKKKHRRDEDSEESESTSDDELDLDKRKSAKVMTQEEKDHQLAMILSRGSIIENLKSRRRSDKPRGGHDSLDKIRKGENAGTPRRVLIESSDDDNGKHDEDDRKEKSDTSSGESSDAEAQFTQPPPIASTSQDQKQNNKANHKEREKGEISSSSSEDEENHETVSRGKQRIKEDRENRKRQKSLTYSSDEYSRKNNGKRAKPEENENAVRHNNHKKPEDTRKRKLAEEVATEPKPKRQMVQKVPSLEMVDISDTELTAGGSLEQDPKAERIRRQSSSSTSSGKNEKRAKTPLRVTLPPPVTSGTPLQSPKMVSPKLISPKPSSSKRPSITSDSVLQEKPLVSPRPRNRTTSSTSSTTSTSKRDVSVVPEAKPSPPVTAKTSVSSIEEFSTREEYTSAAASPMSATGRPMVLTKAAMKAFSSSPPKKQSSSSGPHDSSDSDASSSSSGSSSSDDDSDDENAAIVEQIVNSTTPVVVVAEEVVVEKPIVVEEEDTVLPPPPSTAPQEEEVVVEEPEVEETLETSEALNAPETSQEPLNNDKEAEEVPSSDIVTEVVEAEVEGLLEEEVAKPVEVLVEEEVEETTEEIGKEIEPEKIPSPVTEPQEVEPTTSDSPSPEQMDIQESSCSPSAHTIISDQETDQAVQSIFDEEEADEFPQYPDFVMPNDDKAAPEKATSKPASVGKKSSRSTMSSESSSVDTLMSPKISTSQAEKMSDNSENHEEERPVEPEAVASASSPALAPEPKRQASRYVSDSDDEYGDRPLEIAESSPERTPTPELVPAEKVQEAEVVTEKAPEKTPEPAPVPPQEVPEVETPVPPQEPLEVVVPPQQQQVIQPSPRPAVTPVSTQPISVVQPPQPSPVVVEKSSQQLVIELLAANRLDEVAKIMIEDPTFRNRLDPQTIHLVAQMFHLNSQTSNLPPIEQRKLQQEMMDQYQKAIAAKNAQTREEDLKKFMLEEGENLKRLQQEQPDFKMKLVDQATEGDADALNQQTVPTPNAAFLMNLMPAEARLLLGSQVQSPLVNGSSAQVTPRPSSTASSTTSVRTPLQSVNQIPRSEDGAQFQRWFYHNFPMVWTGRLALKSTETSINLHLINGSETFLNGVLGRQLNEENPRRDSVKIVQRLRLDNGQVEHIYGILTNPEYACCLALSSCTSYGDLAKNEASLKTSFIDYLTKKQIAGISSLTEVEQKFRSARVHVFAPGEIVNRYLSELATSLHDYLQNTETRYLLIVFTNDKVDPNMEGPPPIASLAVPPISSN